MVSNGLFVNLMDQERGRGGGGEGGKGGREEEGRSRDRVIREKRIEGGGRRD